MTERDYAFVAKQLLDRAAIVLEPGKEYLLESRLGPVAKRHGLSSATDFIVELQKSPSVDLMTEFIEAMVTTESSFFRDLHPFETLRREVLPELIAARSASRQLNIWCAASSSGQEPYTLAVILREYFPELMSWKLNVRATDISNDMLARCREGRYSQIEVNRGLPTPLLLKYFRQEGSRWRIVDELRAMVEFSPLNLAKPWPHLPQMDLIFLRNVMIYFDMPTKKEVLRRIRHILRADGYLILGGAETTFNIDASYKRVESLKGGYYRLVPE